MPGTVLIRRTIESGADEAKARIDCDEDPGCALPPAHSSRPGGVKPRPVDRDAVSDQYFGVAWLATALCIAGLVTLCFVVATLARRHFVRAWKRNDVEMWCAPRRVR